MKHIIYSLLIGAAGLTLSSCDLDMTPETTLSDANYWNTEGDLRGACNRFYQQLGGSLGGFNHDYRSDELRGNSANGTSDGSRTVPNTSGDWTDPYWRIFISNNILEKGLKANVSESVRDRYFAEARFFRAFHYFELVKKYGDVPLLLKAVSDTGDPVLKMGRTPREEVIQQCIADLDFAAKNLPDIDHLDSWGHVSRSAALAMLVRVGLYEGTHKKYHHTEGGDYKAHLKVAIDAAEQMINVDKKHDLYPDFAKLFTFDGEGRQNKENVFVKIYGPNGAGTTTHNNSRTMENTAHVTRQTIDKFLYVDGLPREKSPLKVSPETSYDDIFVNRDPRLEKTVWKLGEDAYKGEYKPFAFGEAYNLKKGFMMSEWETQQKETVDKMIIRYAEVLISYAEALYEYNGSITDDQLDKTVNAIRQRAGMPAMLTNAFANANGLDMLEEIRRERAVEFVDECLRYDDIIRWKIAEKVLPTNILGLKFIAEETTRTRDEMVDRLTTGTDAVYNEPDVYILEFAANRRFDPAKDYLYPIPLYEISHSDGNVVQNPGWRE
ncbi:RagB/SusD family nutrient uptake outer membrane protein [Prevotella sp. PINT]|uniref:RagB/SusD family nutrient uptake outer membrane protein n=1 Tax=Palleniella intestinalis TaxID=2736291 RepID=UPI001554CF8A|nr:RagB/SusD family nutrient uptake outer membrane protein [Palleniella intestinalis]NPD81512.1 RagB/SusD family nutrient uptake outer membrane protein [Palleniella intestinalis]